MFMTLKWNRRNRSEEILNGTSTLNPAWTTRPSDGSIHLHCWVHLLNGFQRTFALVVISLSPHPSPSCCQPDNFLFWPSKPEKNRTSLVGLLPSSETPFISCMWCFDFFFLVFCLPSIFFCHFSLGHGPWGQCVALGWQRFVEFESNRLQNHSNAMACNSMAPAASLRWIYRYERDKSWMNAYQKMLKKHTHIYILKI